MGLIPGHLPWWFRARNLNAGDLGSILGREDPLEKEMATTPVFLPRESHGRRSLVGYSPRGRKELDTTERLHLLTYWELRSYEYMPHGVVKKINK